MLKIDFEHKTLFLTGVCV